MSIPKARFRRNPVPKCLWPFEVLTTDGWGHVGGWVDYWKCRNQEDKVAAAGWELAPLEVNPT